MDPSFYDLFAGDAPVGDEQAKALAAALSRDRHLGQLAMLSGDKVLAPLGQGMFSDADAQRGILARAGQQSGAAKLQRAMQMEQAKQQAERDALLHGNDLQKLGVQSQNAMGLEDRRQTGDMERARLTEGGANSRLTRTLAAQKELEEARIGAGKYERNSLASDLRREKATQTNLDRHTKAVSGVQSSLEGLDEVARTLGVNSVDEIDAKDGVRINGRKVDLPGVNIPLLGRTYALSGSEGKNLEGAITRVFRADLRDKSGQSVTTPELELAKQEWESGKFSTEKDMITALQRFKRLAETELARREAGIPKEDLEVYRERGGLVSPQNRGGVVQAATPAPGSGMITVSNGSETLQIPAEDLEAASADGFKRVQ